MLAKLRQTLAGSVARVAVSAVVALSLMFLGGLMTSWTGKGQCEGWTREDGISLPPSFPLTPTTHAGRVAAERALDVFSLIGPPLAYLGLATMTFLLLARRGWDTRVAAVGSTPALIAALIHLLDATGLFGLWIPRDFWGTTRMEQWATQLAGLFFLAALVLRVVWAARAAVGPRQRA